MLREQWSVATVHWTNSQSTCIRKGVYMYTLTRLPIFRTKKSFSTGQLPHSLALFLQLFADIICIHVFVINDCNLYLIIIVTV